MQKLIDDKHAFSGKWYLVNGDLYITISEAGSYDFHHVMYKQIGEIDKTILDYPWFWYPRGMCDAIIPEDAVANLSGPSLLTERQKGVIATEFEATNFPTWDTDEHYELAYVLEKTPNNLKSAAELFFKQQLAMYTGKKMAKYLNKKKDED